MYTWGELLGDPVADEILRALRQAGAPGMSRTEIRDLLGRHRSAAQIDRALTLLARPAGSKPFRRSWHPQDPSL